MKPEDLFVGGLAILLGIAGIAAALVNSDASFRIAKAQWIERWGGRGAARAVYAVVGLLLVVLGIAIAAGFGPNKG